MVSDRVWPSCLSLLKLHYSASLHPTVDLPSCRHCIVTLWCLGFKSTLISCGLESQMSSMQGQERFGTLSEELVSKKQNLLRNGAAADSIRVCTFCNIVCNSEYVFKIHQQGKKHAAQVSGQSAWCEVCKINCNSRDTYVAHLSGKKHLKNMEKLLKSKTDMGASSSVIEHKRKAEGWGTMEKDLQRKKEKLVESGVATAEVRYCTLCGVVCNSLTSFNSHLAGQKHAGMVKKWLLGR